nr:MAG TPA: hypothetical protein [Caudoviricetes sp.]
MLLYYILSNRHGQQFKKLPGRLPEAFTGPWKSTRSDALRNILIRCLQFSKLPMRQCGYKSC